MNSKKKTGRNDPCPCGSEKKYKQCCGKGPNRYSKNQHPNSDYEWDRRWKEREVQRWIEWRDNGNVPDKPPEPIKRYAEDVKRAPLNEQHQQEMNERKKDVEQSLLTLEIAAATMGMNL